MVSSRTTKRRGLVVAALAAAATLALAGGSSAMGRYTDPSGDGKDAADVTGVTLAGDRASGQLLFTINVASLPSDALVFLFLDTDANAATGLGTMAGADYVFVDDQTEHAYSFARWTGSDWDWNTPYSTVRVASSFRGVTISVNRSELGNAQELNFWVATAKAGGHIGDGDIAPDAGTWSYSLAADGPDIRSVLVQADPSFGPKAGKPFTVTPIGLRLGAPTPVLPHPDSYSCTAKLGGRPLAGAGTGGCKWLVPKKARGKTLAVVVTVEYQGATKSVPFSYRVA